MLELAIISLALISGFVGSSWVTALLLSLSLATLSAIETVSGPTRTTDAKSATNNYFLIIHFASGAFFVLLAFITSRQLAVIMAH